MTTNDGKGGTDTSTLAISITPVDGDESVTTPEDTAVSGNVLSNASDIDGVTPSVTYFVVSGTTYTAGQMATLPGVGGLAINANGAYVFTPAANYNGAVPVATYTVSNGKGVTNTSALTISVTPENDAPVDGSEYVTMPEDTTITGNLLSNASDVDGDTLRIDSYTWGGNFYPGGYSNIGPGELMIDSDGSYSFQPSSNYYGDIPTITYTVGDIWGGSWTSTLNITVTPQNEAPVDGNESITLSPGSIFSGNVLSNASDLDGGSLIVDQVFINGGQYSPLGIFVLGADILDIQPDGSYTYFANGDLDGTSLVITYTVSDQQGGFDTSTLTIYGTPVNDAPAANPDAYTTNEDTPWS